MVTAAPQLHRGKTRPDSVHLEVDGEFWAVHDVRFANRRHIRTPLPSSHATHRVFRDAAGVKRSYQFTPGENRQLTATALEAQLRRARYLAATKADASQDAGPFGGPPPGGPLAPPR